MLKWEFASVLCWFRGDFFNFQIQQTRPDLILTRHFCLVPSNLSSWDNRRTPSERAIASKLRTGPSDFALNLEFCRWSSAEAQTGQERVRFVLSRTRCSSRVREANRLRHKNRRFDLVSDFQICYFMIRNLSFGIYLRHCANSKIWAERLSIKPLA